VKARETAACETSAKRATSSTVGARVFATSFAFLGRYCVKSEFLSVRSKHLF